MGMMLPEHGKAPGFGINARLSGMAVDQSERTEIEHLLENERIGADLCLFIHNTLPSRRDFNSTPTRASNRKYALLRDGCEFFISMPPQMSHAFCHGDGVMNPNHTEIAFILDRSGSMSSMIEPAISGFNQLIQDQQQAPGKANFTLVLFDDRYEVPFESVPISEVVELDTTTFVPRGSTALLDAIGRTIDEVGERLKRIPKAERPGQVIIAILTDGQENASERFSWNAVSKKIQHQTDKYQWQFLFLGANQDAIATAGRMSIKASNSSNFTANEDSYSAAKSALSYKMSAMRRVSQGATDAETLHVADAPLESLRKAAERRGK